MLFSKACKDIAFYIDMINKNKNDIRRIKLQATGISKTQKLVVKMISDVN